MLLNDLILPHGAVNKEKHTRVYFKETTVVSTLLVKLGQRGSDLSPLRTAPQMIVSAFSHLLRERQPCSESLSAHVCI